MPLFAKLKKKTLTSVVNFEHVIAGWVNDKSFELTIPLRTTVSCF